MTSRDCEIRVVKAERDLLQVTRFWYDVYVVEMNRPQKDADHEQRMIVDCLLPLSTTIAAFDPEGRIVGTARTNFGRTWISPTYRRLYGLEVSPEDVSITTRLMVAREMRGTSLALRMSKASCVHALASGCYLNFIDCNPHLRPFFERLGYRFIRTFEHPDYGAVLLMRIDLRDVTHLDAVGSPFADLCRAHFAHACSVDYSASVEIS